MFLRNFTGYKRRLGGLILGGLFCFTIGLGSAQADEIVIISSEKANYQVGETLTNSTLLNLKAGAKLTLLTLDGKLHKLAGPFKGTLPKPQKGTLKPKALVVLSALLKDNRKSDLSLGTVRSSGKAVKVPNPWAVNISEPGHGCIKPDRATLWRTRNIDQDAKVTLSAQTSAQKAVVQWVAGYELLNVPGQLFKSDKTYTVDLDGHSVELRVHVMPSEIKTNVEQAVWMANAGCKPQALALLAELQ